MRCRSGNRLLSTAGCRLAVVVCCAVAARPAAAGRVHVTAVTVAGRDVPVPEAGTGGEPRPARLPAAGSLVFRFHGDPADPKEFERVSGRPTRLRFRLDGHDASWRDLPGSGRMLLHFNDADGVMVGTESVIMAGDTPGWRGSIGGSDFQAYELSAVAPPAAATVAISFLSHNAEQVVGCLGVDEIVVRRTRDSTAPVDRRLTPLDLGDPNGPPATTPVGWHRPGTQPSMCSVQIRERPVPHGVLTIIDDDPTRFGNWATSRPIDLDIHPGDRVTVSWTAAHSFGLGGSATATYAQLSPGNYWFRVGAFRANGDASGDEASLPVAVVMPFYRRRDAWGVGLMGMAGAGLLVGRAASARRLKRRLKELERAHSLDRERARIARDLHDEIGAGLTEIAMRSDAVRAEVRDTASADVLAHADGICRTAVDLVRNVDAIVWAVNPANDTLDRFAAYLVQSTEQFLDPAGLSMRFNIPAQLPALPIDGTVRHRLLLAVREALNNAVKHAKADTVSLMLRLSDQRLTIEVADNGRGFDPSTPPAGEQDGLTNMRQRMEELGGTCSITSGIDSGTYIRLEMPCTGTTIRGERLHA